MRARHFARYSILIAVLTLFGFGCKGTPAEVQERVKAVSLEYWRVFDGQDEFESLINAYRKTHPYVSINYKKLRTEEYERALLEAFAEDRGPDIFSIHNTWVGGYENKVLPMPRELTIPKFTKKGGLANEIEITLEKTKTPKPSSIRKAFLPVVASDVVRDIQVGDEPGDVEKKVLGLPLSVDTMALFYNEDLLAQANIPEPPKTWEEFQNAVKTLTKIGSDDVILQSGAAIGTAQNVNRSADLISLLMMQNGAVMADNFDNVTFHHTPPELANEREIPPGIEALIFYTEFANPLEHVYTWNARMPQAFEAFADGKTAFFFGYNYHIPLLATRSPKLNYSVMQVPQLNPNNSVNFASYWVETVSKKTEAPQEAWDFLLYLSQAEQAKLYLEKTGRPTALRELVTDQLEDPVLEPFVNQLLTAKSWYRGKDSIAMVSIMEDMIEEALANAPINPKEAFSNAISRAVSRLSQTY